MQEKHSSLSAWGISEAEKDFCNIDSRIQCQAVVNGDDHKLLNDAHEGKKHHSKSFYLSLSLYLSISLYLRLSVRMSV
jgi:hypothetical protein